MRKAHLSYVLGMKPANADFVTLVDSQNSFGTRYKPQSDSLRYNRSDEAGRLVKAPFNVNVKNQKHLAMLEKWLSDPGYNAMLLRAKWNPQARRL